MSIFPTTEYAARVARAQDMMSQHGLSALLLTTEPEVRYFTGFLTRFWESPTRPWFVIVPASGKPIAVIPAIGAALMAQTWIEDIRTWSAPDLRDDGVSLLAGALTECVAVTGVVGVPDGHESHLRMPLADFDRLKQQIGDRKVQGDAGLLRKLRMVKSRIEIEKIEQACNIASRAFARVPEVAGAGRALDTVFRAFQMLCLEEGADYVPYLAGGAGPGGYSDVISPASSQKLKPGDVLMLDTGLVRDGYYCDFDRNFSVGPAAPETQQAHATLIEATYAGFAAARPGNTAADIFHAMQDVLARNDTKMDIGRLGHGLGMSLTEWPSLTADDHTELECGMVLTLEPGTATQGGILVHEENIVIEETGTRFLTPVDKAELVLL